MADPDGTIKLRVWERHRGAEPPGPGAEPRWPMTVAVLTATILYVGTPHRGRVPGWWLFPVVQLVLLGILIAQDPGRIDRRSPTLRRLMVALLVVMTAGTVLGVVVLGYDILVAAEGVTATVLLGRGAAIWVANVIIFSLWYWEFDRGGPTSSEAAGSPVPASFAFPENATLSWRRRVAAGTLRTTSIRPSLAPRVQPHRHPPGAALGQADHDGPVVAVAGDRDPGVRQGHQRPARLGAAPVAEHRRCSARASRRRTSALLRARLSDFAWRCPDQSELAPRRGRCSGRRRRRLCP